MSTGLACTPSYSSGIADHVQFASIAIDSDGSFNSGTVTETGVIDNEPATFTYTFSGNFHGTTTAGVERIAGQLREEITFNNGTRVLVHDESAGTWSATRDSQGTQTTSPQSGSYTVSSPYQSRSGIVHRFERWHAAAECDRVDRSSVHAEL